MYFPLWNFTKIEDYKNAEEITGVKNIQEIYDTDANFILAKVDDANKRYNEILSKGIVIRNRTTQPLCKDTLRFTVGTKEENHKLIQVLNELL